MLSQDTFPINSIVPSIAGIRSPIIERAPSPNNLNKLCVAIEDHSLEYTPDGVPRFSVHAAWGSESMVINGGEIVLNFFTRMNSEIGLGQYPNFLGSYLCVNKCCITQTTNPWESLMAYLTLISSVNKAASNLVANGYQSGIHHIVRANSHSNPYFERSMSDGIYKYCDPDGRLSAGKYEKTARNDTLYIGTFPNPAIELLEPKFAVTNLVNGLVRTHELALMESNTLLHGIRN